MTEAYIVATARSPIGRARKGSLVDIRPDDLTARMVRAALAKVPEIGEISLACPNKHYVPIDLAPFGLDNPGTVFLPTDEPHGQIEAVVSRA